MQEKNKNDEEQEFLLLNLNPEPIGIFKLPLEKHLKYKEIIHHIFREAPNDLRQKFPAEPYTKHICNISGQNIFESFSQLKDLKSDIKTYLIKYINQIGFDPGEFIINSAWLNDAGKGSNLHFHHHGNSYISANYFVEFDPKTHSQLSFLNDRELRGKYPEFPYFEIKRSINPTIYNTSPLRINCVEGQILFWRSHNIHGYSESNKADGRITLSLNSIPKVLDNGKYKMVLSEK